VTALAEHRTLRRGLTVTDAADVSTAITAVTSRYGRQTPTLLPARGRITARMIKRCTKPPPEPDLGAIRKPALLPCSQAVSRTQRRD